MMSRPRRAVAALLIAVVLQPDVAAASMSTEAAYRVPVTAGEVAWLRKVRRCESTNNYRAVSRRGTYMGAYQFDQRTWESVRGVGRPDRAHPLEQDYRAVVLRRLRGRSPWPRCG